VSLEGKAFKMGGGGGGWGLVLCEQQKTVSVSKKIKTGSKLGGLVGTGTRGGGGTWVSGSCSAKAGSLLNRNGRKASLLAKTLSVTRQSVFRIQSFVLGGPKRAEKGVELLGTLLMTKVLGGFPWLIGGFEVGIHLGVLRGCK